MESDNKLTGKHNIKIIDEVCREYNLVKAKKYMKDFNEVKDNYTRSAMQVNMVFSDLDIEICKYLLHIRNHFRQNTSAEVFINFVDVISKIIAHYKHYKQNYEKQKKCNYNNLNFNNFLVTKYEYKQIFIDKILSLNGKPLEMDEDSFFNYIPITCISKDCNINQAERNYCNFSHNVAEKLYHPLVYKKFPCETNCLKDECPYFHKKEPMNTDLNFDSIKLKDLIRFLQVNDKQSFLNVPNGLATEFNPNTYKVYPCPLGKLCKLYENLCFNYHSDKDRRRNLNIFKYEAKKCEYFIEKKDKNCYICRCPRKDECTLCHNPYELFYHPSKFRTKKCPIETIERGILEGCIEEMHCMFRLTCPYFHKTDSIGSDVDGLYKFIGNDELIYKYYEEMIDDYKEKQINKNKILNKYKEYYKCSKCSYKFLDNVKNNILTICKKDNSILCPNCMGTQDGVKVDLIV